MKPHFLSFFDHNCNFLFYVAEKMSRKLCVQRACIHCNKIKTKCILTILFETLNFLRKMLIGNSFIPQSSQISKFRVARSLQVLSQSKYTLQCRNMYSSFLSLLLLVFLFPRISNLFSPPILLEHIITKGNSRANHLSEEQVVESKFRTVCYFTARLCFSLHLKRTLKYIKKE